MPSFTLLVLGETNRSVGPSLYGASGLAPLGVVSEEESGRHQPTNDRHETVIESPAEHRLFVLQILLTAFGERTHQDRFAVDQLQPADLRLVAGQFRPIEPL